MPAHAAGEASSFYKPGPFSAGYPLLTSDPITGNVVQVRYNNDDRSTMNNLDANSVEEWYVRHSTFRYVAETINQVRSVASMEQMPYKSRLRVLGAADTRNRCWSVFRVV